MYASFQCSRSACLFKAEINYFATYNRINVASFTTIQSC